MTKLQVKKGTKARANPERKISTYPGPALEEGDVFRPEPFPPEPELDIQPLNGFVLVRMEDEEDRHGALYIPAGSLDEPTKPRAKFGVVIANASGPPITKFLIGDTVLLPKMSGHYVYLKGVEHRLIKAEEILGRCQVSEPKVNDN